MESGQTALDGRLDLLEARNLSGTGSPEAAVTAAPGSLCRQTDGVEGQTPWIKDDTGTDNTGWRLLRRVIPSRMDLLSPVAVSGLAVQAAQTSYAGAVNALTATSFRVDTQVSDRVIQTVCKAVWTPNATGCGLRFRHFEGGPTAETVIQEYTGLSDTAPISSATIITSTVQSLVDHANEKFIDFQAKGNGTVGPAIYAVWVELLWEA